MRQERIYFVYILASRSRTLYVGVTNSVVQRVKEHREGTVSSFTKQYRIHRLVYYEEYHDIEEAIRREKVIKGWRRERKLQLIESINPAWEDLYEDFGKPAFYREPKRSS
jgi:putative endonuclease